MQSSSTDHVVFRNVEFVAMFNTDRRRSQEMRWNTGTVGKEISHLRLLNAKRKAVLRFASAMMRFATQDHAAKPRTSATRENIYRKSTRTASMDSTVTRFGTTEIQSKGVISSWSFVGAGRLGECHWLLSAEKYLAMSSSCHG